MKRFELPGCFWIILILLILGGPQFVGAVFTFLFVLFVAFIVIAVVFGQLLIRNINVNDYVKNQSEDHNTFAKFLVQFMVKMAQADGEVSDIEVQTIKNFFHVQFKYGSIQMTWVERLINDAMEEYVELQYLCDEFNDRFGLSEKRVLVQILYMMAFSDGILHDNEERLIDEIVQFTGFSIHEKEQIKNMFKNQSTQGRTSIDAYDILGVSQNSTKEEIKKKYRDLSKEYHPDKVAHLGEDFKNIAEEKMSKINEAYAELKRQGVV